MKRLGITDGFAALRIIKKANIKEELKPFIEKCATEKGKVKVEDIGIEAVLTLIEILTEKKAEYALYEFLAAPFEMSVEDVSKMDLAEFIKSIMELAEMSDLKDFFTSLRTLIISKSQRSSTSATLLP